MQVNKISKISTEIDLLNTGNKLKFLETNLSKLIHCAGRIWTDTSATLRRLIYIGKYTTTYGLETYYQKID